MNQTAEIVVRFVCPWRGHRPGDVATIPRPIAFELIRHYVATPAGQPAETTAFTAPREMETRADV